MNAALLYQPIASPISMMKAYANTTSTMSSMMTRMANALLNPTDSSVDVLLEIIYPRLCGTVTNMPRVKPLTRPRLTTFCQSAPYDSKACYSNRISGTITIPWACIRIASALLAAYFLRLRTKGTNCHSTSVFLAGLR